MDKKVVKDIFEREAREWIAYSHNAKDFIYPTAYHRVRILCSMLADCGKELSIADLGCGGGHLALSLAEAGHRIVGVDQAEAMIAIAERSRSAAAPEIQERVAFRHAEIENSGLQAGSFEAVTAMGVIGYLDEDDGLFHTARMLLKSGGFFAVSCRNRLFNMNSLSHRTLAEIRTGHAEALVREIHGNYQSIPAEAVRTFRERVRDAAARIKDVRIEEESPAGMPPNAFQLEKTEPEARQHTPQGLAEKAAEFGFELRTVRAVHPHLIDPNLNRLLPAGMFDLLSGCLEAFEHLPVALGWSSVFISLFEKKA